MFNYVSRPQNSCWTISRLQKNLSGPKNAKKDSKIKSKSKVSIEENIEIQSYSTRWVDPKTVFEPNPATPPKSGQNQKLELKKL